MKNLKLLIAICFITFSCVSNTAKLKIVVKPFKSYEDNEYALCFKKYDNKTAVYYAYDTMYINHSGQFEINDLNIGRYSIAIMHPASEIVLSNIHIIEENAVIEMLVEMDRVSIPDKIDSIRIVGDFNDYNHWGDDFKMEFDENENYWFANVDKEDFGEFYFIINFNEKTHTSELPVSKKIDPFADLHNELAPGTKKIIFDPSKLNRLRAKPKVTFKGDNSDFNMIFEQVDEIAEELSDMYREILDDDDLVLHKKLYNEKLEVFNKIKEENNEKFEIIFPHYQFMLYNYHPINKELQFAYKKDKDLSKNIREGEEYVGMMNDKAIMLSKLKKDPLMLTPKIIQLVNSYASYYARMYDVYEELDIPFGWYDQFLSDLPKEMDDDEIVGETLYLKARNNSRRNPSKAISIFNEIKDKYPDYSGLEDGRVEKELKTLAVVSGAAAPNFEVVTLEGETISLASLKGKNVFLDFWGTWCAPCRGEIPHIVKMHKEISSEELVIVGLVCGDTESKVKTYIEENKIKYANAIANDDLKASYGIRSYPTTFLINKEGIIIDENLRGSGLTDRVKHLIE